MARIVPNIYIVGAQSTGKSTLALALMDHFDKIFTDSASCVPFSTPRLIKEVAREAMQRLGLTTDETFSSPSKILQLQQAILEAQTEAEGAPGWFISDRSGLDPMVYARVLGKDERFAVAMEASKAGQDLLENMRQSLVLVCEPNLDWLVDDGTRYMPESNESWEGFHRKFCKELLRLEIPFRLIPADETDISRRVSLAVQWWSRLGGLV